MNDSRPVLYVLKRFPRLSETFLLHEMLNLEARGMRLLVDALLEPEDEPRHPELAHLRAAVRYLPRHPRLADPQVAAAHFRLVLRAPGTWLVLALQRARSGGWRRFLQAGLIADRALSQGARHLHAHFASAAAEAARDAGRLAGLPITVTAHAKDIFQADHAHRLARRMDGISGLVTISEFNLAHLRRLLPALPVHHVPNGVDLEPARPFRGEGPVLCVARLVAKKGLDVLLDAVAVLAPRLPGLEVEVVGDGPLRNELMERCRRLGLEDVVRLAGALPSNEVDLAFRRCSIFVLPCRVTADGDRDGLPSVLLEAMARGVPVISTRVVGIPELVRDGQTGLLVPPDDPAALALAMERLLTDRALAARLGARGREHVASHHDPAQSAALLHRLFTGAGG